MKLITVPRISNEDTCTYLPNNLERHEFFFAEEITNNEMDFFLSKGWRKFGQFLFRPRCKDCTKCIPLRVITSKFRVTKSDRRTINKNSDIVTSFCPLIYKRIYFDLYMLHAKERFQDKQIDNEEDFIQTFFCFSGTQIVSEFYLGDTLAAYGILDKTSNSLSSVYFVFDPKYLKRGLGTFGALKEIEYCKLQDIKHYYLGYWIEQNKSMKYKSHFRPYELYEWETKEWSKD